LVKEEIYISTKKKKIFIKVNFVLEIQVKVKHRTKHQILNVLRAVMSEEMNEEILSLEKNQTWKLVSLPKNQRVVGSKWVFKKKEGIPGVEALRHKARLVTKDFT